MLGLQFIASKFLIKRLNEFLSVCKFIEICVVQEVDVFSSSAYAVIIIGSGVKATNSLRFLITHIVNVFQRLTWKNLLKWETQPVFGFNGQSQSDKWNERENF
jgi:hypothetical protein